VKKKYYATSKDKKDWSDFTNQLENVYDKEANHEYKNKKINKIKKLDLHGFSLIEANKITKEFINKSYEDGYKKLLIVTGKGLRSKIFNNPYRSEKMNVLKYSVPEYIKNDENLFNKINKISTADLEDGGEGAIYVLLKKSKKL
jgi:DNA-nicking Smr family endonuclease